MAGTVAALHAACLISNTLQDPSNYTWQLSFGRAGLLLIGWTLHTTHARTVLQGHQ